jgi:hypothetical protein
MFYARNEGSKEDIEMNGVLTSHVTVSLYQSWAGKKKTKASIFYF